MSAREAAAGEGPRFLPRVRETGPGAPATRLHRREYVHTGCGPGVAVCVCVCCGPHTGAHLHGGENLGVMCVCAGVLMCVCACRSPCTYAQGRGVTCTPGGPGSLIPERISGLSPVVTRPTSLALPAGLGSVPQAETQAHLGAHAGGVSRPFPSSGLSRYFVES